MILIVTDTSALDLDSPHKANTEQKFGHELVFNAGRLPGISGPEVPDDPELLPSSPEMSGEDSDSECGSCYSAVDEVDAKMSKARITLARRILDEESLEDGVIQDDDDSDIVYVEPDTSEEKGARTSTRPRSR